MEILDVGCGKSELSYALSQSVARVAGVDHSFAIQIAKAAYLNNKTVNYLEFIQDTF
jgi:2-polyprenyl-3-methyl-5-hydroxy-6-metoxy-1,4-benzoquinol methylase